MKYLYLILFTLITMISTEPSLQGATSYPPSESGSFDSTTTYTPYVCPDLDSLSFDELTNEFDNLMEAYTRLLKYVSAKDARLNKFVIRLDSVFPNGVERAEAVQDNLVTLRSGVLQLVQMYNTLTDTAKKSTEKVSDLESDLTKNAEKLEALQNTVGLLRENLGLSDTTFSPFRLRPVVEKVSEQAKVLAGLRDENTQLRNQIVGLEFDMEARDRAGELDLKTLRVEKKELLGRVESLEKDLADNKKIHLENQRLKDENQRLKALSMPSNVATSTATGYRQLNGESCTVGASKKEQQQGCPSGCTIQ